MWIPHSLLAALCFTGIFLVFKQLQIAEITTSVILFWTFLFGTLFYGVHVLSIGKSFFPPGSAMLLLLTGAALSYLGNLVQTKAIGAAPNPGFAIAVVSSQAALTSILAVYLFGSELSWSKILGIVVTLLGVTIVSL